MFRLEKKPWAFNPEKEFYTNSSTPDKNIFCPSSNERFNHEHPILGLVTELKTQFFTRNLFLKNTLFLLHCPFPSVLIPSFIF
jgi:hypothetical protein